MYIVYKRTRIAYMKNIRPIRELFRAIPLGPYEPPNGQGQWLPEQFSGATWFRQACMVLEARWFISIDIDQLKYGAMS